MCKAFNYFSVFVFICFLFIVNVNAECSYKERKELLNEANSVEIAVEPVVSQERIYGSDSFSEENEEFLEEKYSFDFVISNIYDDLFIKYYNDMDGFEEYLTIDDFNESIYIFNDDNADDFKTYYFEFRSLNENCYGDIVTTKKIKKPIYNYLSSLNVCSNEKMINSKYCQKFITKSLNITEKELLKKASEEINNEKKEEKDKSSFLLSILKYWYVILIIIFICVLLFVILKIKKRRESLK